MIEFFCFLKLMFLNYLQNQNHFLVCTYVVYAITLYHGPIYYMILLREVVRMLLYC